MTAVLPDIDPQVEASDPRASVFVTANAGSGKTTTLVARVARLLRTGVDPAAILCVTYTKAAAAEMQGRLYERLGGWAVMADDKLSAELAKLEGTPGAAFDHAALSQARTLFARALETPGGLKIETIHAFCEKLLKRFPLEAGVSPRFHVLDEPAARALSKSARDDLALLAMNGGGALGAAFAHFAIELDPIRFDELFQMLEQRRDALTDYLEACATGAKRTPAQLCGVAEDADPLVFEAEAVAATDWVAWRAAEAELRTGSSADLSLAAEMAKLDADTATFDAVCGVFCTEKGAALARLATKKIAAGTTAWLIAEQTRLLEAREPIRAARTARDTRHLLTLAAAYAALYIEAKTAARSLDFADLIAKTQRLLASEQAAAWVLYKLDNGLEHVLLDEAQDTAPEQWEILKNLTAEFYSGTGRRDRLAPGRTVFAVGDEKQSIYSFQGARPEMLAKETQDYIDRAGEAQLPAYRSELKVSWRSTPEVLRFVDTVFAQTECARALDSEYESVEHVASRQGQPGTVDLWPLFKETKPPERDAWMDPVDADAGLNQRKLLAQRIAREIIGAVNRGEAVHDKALNDGRGGWRAANYGDFLILVRRRDGLFEEIIRALKQKGAPVAGADRLKLSEHIVFDDLRALARFALYPRDDLTVAELLRSPFCAVNETSLFDLAYGREQRSLWDVLRARGGERAEWTTAHGFLEVVLEESRRAPFEFYNRLLGRIDGDGRSMRARILSRLGREAEDAIDEFLNQVLACEARGVFDLEGLAAELDASDVLVKRELESARGDVRVMTVHGAKGLEAPVVFLPDTTVKARPQGPPLLETGAGEFLWAPRGNDDCPASAGARALRDLRIDQESLRLLYVALTRARDRVVICGRAPATKNPDKGSWWTRLNDAFDVLSEETRVLTVEETTVTRFGHDPSTAPRLASAEAEDVALPAWVRTPLKPERGARWASPSNISDQAKAPAPSPLAERFGLGRFRRGDLIHKLFEVLPDIVPEHRRAAAQRLMAREVDLTPDQRAEMIAAAFGVLEDPRFAEVFGPGSRAEAALAGTAPDLPQGVAISGRLDRLVVGPDRVLVVDYKTNRPAPATIEDADPAYLTQMAVYVAVLRALYPGRAVEAALVWTDGPRLMPVPQDVIGQALESLRRDS